MRVRLLLLLWVSFSLSCSTIPVARMPDGFPRLPAASSFENVWVEGRFYTDHDRIFDQDLLEVGIVPVAVRVFLRGSGDETSNPRVSVEDIQPELYLADGTRLALVPYDSIKVDRAVEDRITEEALDINVIKPEAQSKEGFIFFQLPSHEFEVQDTDTLVHLKKPLGQEIRISDSLLALAYFTNDGARPIHVGLRKDRRDQRR